MRYIIVYQPFHDNDWLYPQTFATLEDTVIAIERQTHNYYEYEGIAVYEIGESLQAVAWFSVERDNTLVRTDDLQWAIQPIRDWGVGQ